MKTLAIPATTKSDAAVVSLAPDGTVSLDNVKIGAVSRGSYTYSPKASGRRVVRFHSDVDEWQAATPDGHQFRGGDWKGSRRKNSRLAAIAFLVAAARGVPASDAEYFYWSH